MRHMTPLLAVGLVVGLAAGCGGKQEEKQAKQTVEPVGSSTGQTPSAKGSGSEQGAEKAAKTSEKKAKTAAEQGKAETKQGGTPAEKAAETTDGNGKADGGQSTKAEQTGGQGSDSGKKAEKQPAETTAKGDQSGDGKNGGKKEKSSGKAAGDVVRVTDNPAADLKVEQPKVVDGVVEVKVLAVGTLKANAFYYNIKELHVRPGQKVRVIFKNVGKMPKAAGGHQFIVIKKDTKLQTFVTKATQAGLQNDYIPQGEKMQKQIIAASALLGPGQQETVEFTAPEKPGARTFLCTFPGHFATMKGKLVVEKP